jgi:exosortase
MKSPGLLLFGLLILVIGAVYAPIVIGLAQDWLHDPNYSHGFLVPCVSGFLIWQRRREFAALPRSSSIWGWIGLFVSSALLVIGTAGAEVFTQRISLILLLASLALCLGGPAWFRKLAFPLGFLFFAIPLPYIVYYGLTGPMQAFAAKLAVVGLRWVGVPALAEGNVIHLPEMSLEVAEACSGIRSLYAFLALGALFAHTMPIPFGGRLLLFLSTIPLSVFANAVRVWGSGIGAHVVGAQAVEGTVHELFGVVVFVGSIGLFLLVRKGARVLWPSAS